MKWLFACCLAVVFVACSTKEEPKMTPWGTVMGEDRAEEDTTTTFTLDDIIANGEMIMLTMSGPETYYDYHGHGMGVQYLLCEKFAREIGVTLRVELCTDTTEMINRLKRGDADIIVYPLPKTLEKANGLLSCGAGDEKAGVQWAVTADNQELADTLNHWYKPEMIAQVKQRESYIFSAQSITRHVYAPVLDGSGGVISNYDGYFKKYSGVVGIDWRLMAAQCYQESTFDPMAQSWAGARGLMQIMPSTADHLGLARSDMNDPEKNIAAASRYIRELNQHFGDISNPRERQDFVLAAYNGGYFHIRDAMRLAERDGQNAQRWDVVAQYVLRLSDPRFYQDPIVKYGYMRGSETKDYVERIRTRWQQYRGAKGGAVISTPHKSSHGQRRAKYHLQPSTNE